MKYHCEVDIDLPIDRVVELFENPDNLKHWQPGLISWDLISGERGQPGARAKLVFSVNGKNVEMIETVTVRNPPREYSGTYEGNNIFNSARNYFVPVSETRTRYLAEQEYTFSGMMRVIGRPLGGLFKKTTQQYMDLFKAFAESQAATVSPKG